VPSDPTTEPDGAKRATLLDTSVLIVALALPWVLASDAWPRAGVAAFALVAWFVLVRPGWRGLLHFYGTLALGLALCALAAIALFG